MKISWQTYIISGKSIDVRATEYNKDDKGLIGSLYFQWRDLNKSIKYISTRGINLPEAISENAFCLFFENCVRVVKLKKGKCSYDALNIKTGKKIQIKATSIPGDLSSFGPKSEWDELYFLDFSRADGTFDIYKIHPDLIYKHKVNTNQTFEDQQKQGKRPRLSIKEIIRERRILPIKTCSLN